MIIYCLARSPTSTQAEGSPHSQRVASVGNRALMKRSVIGTISDNEFNPWLAQIVGNSP